MKKEVSLNKAILGIAADFGRALHPRELAAQLHIESDDYNEYRNTLDTLIDDGYLKELPGGRIRFVKSSKKMPAPRESRPKQEKNLWQGTITVHPRGFGFVVSDGHDDVFIPADGIYEAMQGDTVTVRATGRSRKGVEGVVENVVKRGKSRITGVVKRKRKSAWLEPDDARMRGPILLREGGETTQDGDCIIATIIRYPQFADELPEARADEILGPSGDLRTEVRKILLAADVREEHPPEALQNAELMAARLGTVPLKSRRDLRHVPLPTIDPEDARDHDDAIWVERYRGGYRAYIAIADVSEYVREDSPLDAEARERGCTIYLPDRAIPMLPRVLAADLCSLLPEQERYCLCVIAELSKHGKIKRFEVVEGLMRSQARLTYGGVANALGLDPESPQSDAADGMRDNLEVLYELSQKLRQMRFDAGSLNLDLPEPQVVMNDDGDKIEAVEKRATRPGMKIAYTMVEEMMLLANQLVAEWIQEKDLVGIYRVHGQPDPEKLEKLGRLAEKIGLDIDVPTLQEPGGAADFLQEIQDHPRKSVLEMLMLRSLKQAQYDIENIGHFGLGKQDYLHFTSPIRRYPDLRVHRQMKRVIRGERIVQTKSTTEDLSAAAGEASRKERAAIKVEREVLDLYRASYMQDHIGDTFDAKITGFSGMGVFVAVSDPFVDVLIPYEALGEDLYELDEDDISVTGSRTGECLMMADSLKVEIMDVTLARRQTLGRRVVDQATPREEISLDDEEGAWPERHQGGLKRRNKSASGNYGARRTTGTTRPFQDSKNNKSRSAASTDHSSNRTRRSLRQEETSSAERGSGRTTHRKQPEERRGETRAGTRKTSSSHEQRSERPRDRPSTGTRRRTGPNKSGSRRS